MKRIALTLADGTPVYVNADAIKYIRPGDDDDTSEIFFLDGTHEIVAKPFEDLGSILDSV